jgi:hypothetical protein
MPICAFNLPARGILANNPPFGGSEWLPFILCEQDHGSSEEESQSVAAGHAA